MTSLFEGAQSEHPLKMRMKERRFEITYLAIALEKPKKRNKLAITATAITPKIIRAAIEKLGMSGFGIWLL
jgi:hypothetical protein